MDNAPYAALLFDWLITLTLTIFDIIILEQSAGSKSGVYVDFDEKKAHVGKHVLESTSFSSIG